MYLSALFWPKFSTRFTSLRQSPHGPYSRRISPSNTGTRGDIFVPQMWRIHLPPIYKASLVCSLYSGLHPARSNTNTRISCVQSCDPVRFVSFLPVAHTRLLLCMSVVICFSSYRTPHTFYSTSLISLKCLFFFGIGTTVNSHHSSSLPRLNAPFPVALFLIRNATYNRYCRAGWTCSQSRWTDISASTSHSLETSMQLVHGPILVR